VLDSRYTILSRKNLSLGPAHLHPCCDSPSPSKSSRRPPSTPTSTPQVPGSRLGSSYDPYDYGSLSSTPQLSATDYLPATPEAPAVNFDMAMGAFGDSCGYMPQYQPSPSLYANSPDGSELMMSEAMGMRMRYDFRDGLEQESVRYPGQETFRY
jgi:myb proto-oncogene protein